VSLRTTLKVCAPQCMSVEMCAPADAGPAVSCSRRRFHAHEVVCMPETRALII
jgi:hypothetical protein